MVRVGERARKRVEAAATEQDSHAGVARRINAYVRITLHDRMPIDTAIDSPVWSKDIPSSLNADELDLLRRDYEISRQELARELQAKADELKRGIHPEDIPKMLNDTHGDE